MLFEDLVGNLFIASIGEPFDFESEFGSNKLSGKILKIIISEKGQPRIHCEVTPFIDNGKKITQIVGVNRYVSSQNVIDELNKDGAILNFMFQKSGDSFNYVDGLDEVLKDKDKCSFLIGTMKLV